MSDITIEAAEALQKAAGITFEQALYIVQSSRVMNLENWRDWVEDIERVVKIDSMNG